MLLFTLISLIIDYYMGSSSSVIAIQKLDLGEEIRDKRHFLA